MEIWHNPRCSKSRAAKQALDDAGETYTERRYLDDPPTEAELDHVLTLLDKEPWEIARKGETRYKELNLATEPHDRAKWIKILAENPVLIERPIVIKDDEASIER